MSEHTKLKREAKRLRRELAKMRKVEKLRHTVALLQDRVRHPDDL